MTNKILLLATFSVLSLMTLAGTAYASSVAQRFDAGESGIVGGAIVSVADKGGSSAVLATVSNRSRLVGVVSKQASLELGDDTVGVVVNGAAATLVSTFNGDIKAGDRITASPIAGVGMKATEAAMVVGTAQNDLDLTNTEERTVTGTAGNKKTVKIGAVPMLVAPAYYEASTAGTAKTASSQLQLFASNLAGHTVSPVRVLVAGVVILVLVAAVLVLIYTSVRASMVAIGRNPLSKSAVYRSLYQVGVAAMGVSAFTVIMVYLILTT